MVSDELTTTIMTIWPFIRIFLGLLFILSGSQKLIHPYQNFQYVIEAYAILPSGPWGMLVAKVMPWVELATGVFLLVGLWAIPALQMAKILFLTFIIIVGQALVRHLPIYECGCFGEALSVPPEVMLMLDTVFFTLTVFMTRHRPKVIRFGLDQLYEEPDKK